MWRVAKNRLKRELGLTSHTAVVAKDATRTLVPTMGVPSLWYGVLKVDPHWNIGGHHDNYNGENTKARENGSTHMC